LKIDLSNNAANKAAQAVKDLGAHGKLAVSRSLNRAIGGVKTDAAREVRERYNLKAGAIKKTFTPGKSARANSLFTSTRSIGTRSPLIAFQARPSRPGGRRPANGVSVNVRNRRKAVDGSFVARMKSGHIGVFQRSGEFGRNENNDMERIKELHTLAVPQAIEWQEGAKGQISEKAVCRFEKRIDHEVGRALEKMGAR
jgi:hypothetical protein